MEPPAWHDLRISAVDAVGLEARATALAGRSIKKQSKLVALDLAIRCMDLTTLEGVDTPGKVVALCAKAVRPDPLDPTVPSVAAVCVYPELVPIAARTLRDTTVAVASVAGSFPAGLGPLEVRLREIEWAVEQGADEIDIVLNRSAFFAVLAMAAGADFIKTSTGKIGTAATLPVALCMSEAIRDYHEQTGRMVGLKVAGGVRTAKQSWQYLVIVSETLGSRWMTPTWFRIGASSLLNDVLMQIRMQREGRYQRPDDFTID